MSGVTPNPSPMAVRAPVVRTVLALAAALAIAACNDDSPVEPRAHGTVVAAPGVKPAAVINILPAGQTFPNKIAFATGSPVGKEAKVQVYDKNGTQLATFYAFSAAEDFTAGVEVAVGDVNGDGWPDIVAGEGPTPSASWSSQINVWDGKTGSLIKSMTPYVGAKDGYRVATGDIDGNGSDEILGCRMPGGTTHGVALRLDGTAIHWFTLYGNAGWANAGCDIDAGDINGDGKKEIVVKYDGVWNTITINDHANDKSFGVSAPLTGYTGSTSLAMGDVNGDKKAEIILATRSAVFTAPEVIVFDGRTIQPNAPLFKLMGFKPYSFWWKTGVELVARDIHGDGQVEILTKPTVSPYSELGALNPLMFTTWLFYKVELGNIPAGGGIG
jgi:FG-GAP-like repeat